LKTKEIIFWIVFVAVNLLTYFLMIPFAQKLANSHMNDGPFFGILYFIVGGIVAGLMVFQLLKRAKIKTILPIILLVLSIGYWGYELYTIDCLGCLKAG
jgi:uncharacterized membrane protein